MTRHIVISAVLTLLFAGCTSKPVEVVQTPEPTPQIEVTNITESTPRQITYTSEADATQFVSRGPVVYFFKANWCPTCQALQRELDDTLSTLPAGTTIVTVDYDTATELKTKYAVTYQHTLVQIDSNGNELAKWQGGGVDEIKDRLVL